MAKRHPREINSEDAGLTEREDADARRLGWELDMLFSDYEDGSFVINEGMHSAWIMTLPDETDVTRSMLQDLARPFIEKGTITVPHLFKWVMHENLAIRYIAIYSLEKITGISYGTSYFRIDEDRADRNWAVAHWKEWLGNEQFRR